MTIATGTRLGRYEVRSQLGAGGMGEVYLARDPKLGRDVPSKSCPPNTAGTAGAPHVSCAKPGPRPL